MIVDGADSILPVVDGPPVDGRFTGGTAEVNIIDKPVDRFAVRIRHRVKRNPVAPLLRLPQGVDRIFERRRNARRISADLHALIFTVVHRRFALWQPRLSEHIGQI